MAFLNLVRYIFKAACLDIKALCVLQLPGKRYKSFIQSSLDDFVYEPGNLFQGGY